MQAGLFGVLAVGLGALSVWPAYRALPSDAAVIKLSFSHSADRREACAKLTPEEMARLPINMRMRTDCRRDRWPVYVELWLDGRKAYSHSLPPAGLQHDGPSTIYQRVPVPAGVHHVDVRLRDTGRTDGYDAAAARDIELSAGQSFVVDFDNAGRQFTFR